MGKLIATEFMTLDGRAPAPTAPLGTRNDFFRTISGSAELLFHEHTAGDAGEVFVGGIGLFARDDITRTFVQVPSAVRGVRGQRQARAAQSRRFFVGPSEELGTDTFAAPRRIDMEFGDIERIGRRQEFDALPSA